MTKTRQFSFTQVHRAAMVYIALPLFGFFGGFLRWYYALVCCAALFVTLWFSARRDGLEPEYQKPFSYSPKTIGLVFLFCLLWSYLGGMNGFWYQSSDWNCRNAIYFDLIRFDWPVVYSANGGALVYYIGHWLPPALAAKLFQALTGSAEAGLMAGRMLLWLWSSLGLTIILLLLFPVVGADTGKKRVAAVFLFAFFSGMDSLGAVLLGTHERLFLPGVLHLEWWNPGYQFSSITTCLYWVFNQAIVPWMITLCFLVEDSPRNYVFYGVSCLLCGTLPCFGLAALMLVKALMFCVKTVREKQARRILREFFSLQNLLALLILFPVVAAYILSNTFAGTAQETQPAPEAESSVAVQAGEDAAPAEEAPRPAGIAERLFRSVARSIRGIFSREYIGRSLCIFLMFEAGFYLLCIFPDHWKDPLFYALGLSFFLIPYFHVGMSNDCCMRASVPGVFVLMVFVSRYLLAHLPGVFRRRRDGGKKDLLRTVSALVLAVCFLSGTVTPLVEVYRGVYHVVDSGTVCLEGRSLMTFDREHIAGNFSCKQPEEQFFFRYLAG